MRHDRSLLVSDRFGRNDVLHRHHDKSKDSANNRTCIRKLQTSNRRVRNSDQTLHCSADNNALGVGLNMNKVLLPQFETYSANTSIYRDDTNRGQVNPSSLLSYLGIKGFGRSVVNQYLRRFPAIFNLAYWDIFKNYYANKQEENAYVITGVNHIWKKLSAGDGIAWNRVWTYNSSEAYPLSPSSQAPCFIKLEFEEKYHLTKSMKYNS